MDLISGFTNFDLGGPNVRWPTTVTSKQNAHIKFKSLTANSNHSQQIKNPSQQIQIAHSKLKIAHSNSNCSQQITNPPPQITNRSHQIQIAHSKYKYGECKTKTADWGKKQTEGKMQTAD